MSNVAVNDRGQVVRLFDFEVVEEFESHVKNMVYSCPECGGKMHFKQGPQIRAHFAHNPKQTNCSERTYLQSRTFNFPNFCSTIESIFKENLGYSILGAIVYEGYRFVVPLDRYKNNFVLFYFQTSYSKQEFIYKSMLFLKRSKRPVFWFFDQSNDFLNRVFINSFTSKSEEDIKLNVCKVNFRGNAFDNLVNVNFSNDLVGGFFDKKRADVNRMFAISYVYLYVDYLVKDRGLSEVDAFDRIVDSSVEGVISFEEYNEFKCIRENRLADVLKCESIARSVRERADAVIQR